MKIIRISQQEITLEMVKDTNCPPDILAEVLKRGNDDRISWEAARNPNCPPKEKWIWKNLIRLPYYGFVHYLDAPPEIKQDPEIRKKVFQKMLMFLDENMDKLSPKPQTNPFHQKIERLLKEEFKDRLLAAIFLEEWYKKRKENENE